MWQVNILTLFPEVFPGVLSTSITGSALKAGVCSINAYNIRDYAQDKHKTVDDTSYGGGGGMVIKPDVLAAAIDDKFISNGYPIYYLSPRGRVFNQKIAYEMVTENPQGINLICGRFEGIDERILLEYDIREISMGDFVVTCGDVVAYSMLDCCIRLLPDVLDDERALNQESFGMSKEYENLLEYPHYTKPAVWRERSVPDVLLSGNHKNIDEWRLEKAIEKTRSVRPELLDLCGIKEKK